eukprot:TRINITY_DN4684_c0_g1_i1.p1 TRINITY_DN4684_c0_g1~~TRINITY_DN4684_c0_g1_i1.p1  ORF type:complete len:580 (+),score=39.59 TRINITY_DN4684_c0_g1_i1:78-1817(+)
MMWDSLHYSSRDAVGSKASPTTPQLTGDIGADASGSLKTDCVTIGYEYDECSPSHSSDYGSPQTGWSSAAAGGTEESHISDLIRSLSETVEATPEILRAVTPRTILWSGGHWIRSGPIGGGEIPSPAEANEMYAKSFRVERLTHFLSHSWHAPAWTKVAALFAYYNAGPAVLAGLCVGHLFALLRVLEIVPAWVIVEDRLYSMVSSDAQLHIPWSCWGLMGYTIGYAIVLRFGQMIQPVEVMERSIFFDKLCIHQTDTYLKMRGIQSLGAYLLRSKDMLIMWDQTYFERVWCVFEIAVFLALNPGGQIRLHPIAMYCSEVYVSFLLILWCWSFALVLSLGMLAPQVDWIIRLGVPNTLVLPFFLFLPTWVIITAALLYGYRPFMRARDDIVRQLKQFTVATAKCFDERDRAYIQETICTVYGSTDEFEKVVRTKVQRIVSNRLGPSMTVPYLLTFRTLAGLWCFFALDVGIAVGPSLVNVVHWVAGSFIFLGFLVPVFIVIIQMIASVQLWTRSWTEDVCLCSFFALVLSSLTSLIFASFPFMLGTDVRKQLVMFLLGCIALATTKWMQPRCLARARTC